LLQVDFQAGDAGHGAEVLGFSLLDIQFGRLSALVKTGGDFQAAFLQVAVFARNLDLLESGQVSEVCLSHLCRK
jgi:hypothetical protein